MRAYITRRPGKAEPPTPPIPPKASLQNTSWSDINLAAAAGLASEYWSIGDTKTLNITSTLGSTTITLQIAGFNYDDLADGSGKAPISFFMAHAFANTQRMHSSDTSVGGWDGSEFSTTILPVIASNIKNAIGSNIVKPVIKRIGAGNLSTSIKQIPTEFWQATEFEVFGEAPQSAVGEKPTGINSCYPIFTDNNSRIRKLGSVTGSSEFYWCSSPSINNVKHYCLVDYRLSDLHHAHHAYTYPSGIVLGFCV